VTLYATGVGLIALIGFAIYLLGEGISPLEAWRRLTSRSDNK